MLVTMVVSLLVSALTWSMLEKKNNATFEQNKVLAFNSIKIAKNSFYVAIVAMIASIAGLAISFFN